MAGVVVAAGAKSGVLAGERVLAHTKHASSGRFDRRDVVCVPLPDGLDDQVAPFARLAQVTGVIIQIASAQPGDVIAVVGLGAIGNLGAQLGRASGMDVVGVDPSAFRRGVAQDCGVATAAPDAAAAALAGRGGAQLVLECSGRAAGVVLATELCARYGEVMTVGAPWTGDVDVPASRVVANVFEKFLALRSGWEWQVPRYAEPGRRSVASCTSWILGLLQRGSVVTEPLVSGVVDPSGVAGAYGRLDRQPDGHLTFVIDWRR
jgi:threonine dehydrogenase-like Zn-dependent dehydrogenase